MSATTGGKQSHSKPLTGKTVPQLRSMAKKAGVKQTRSDGTHKTKAQLMASIRRADYHGGASGGAVRRKAVSGTKKKKAAPRY